MRSASLHPALDVRPDDARFEKAHPSSFQGTGLQSFLQRAGILGPPDTSQAARLDTYQPVSAEPFQGEHLS